MKKQFKFFSVLFAAAAMMASCSNDEPVNPGGEISDGTPRYLSVNIVSANGMGSRAAGDQHTGNPTDIDDPQKSATYEEGLEAENNVSKVRFYFFDSKGEPVSVKAGSTANYWDWVKEANADYGTGVEDPYVERILNAVVVISTKEGDALPTQIVAVVNPRAALGTGSYSLSGLRGITSDYATYANGGKVNETSVGPNHFPMCNAVYMNDGNEVVKAAKVDPSYYESTPDKAIKNPVKIYVERNVAKIRVHNKLTAEANGLIKLKAYVKDEAGNITTPDLTVPYTDAKGNTTDKQVYLKLNGWNVTADMNKAYLSKRINTDWTDTGLGFVWNYPTFFRSYWAEQTPGTNNRYGNYNDADNKEFEGYTYANENVVAPHEGKLNASSKRNTKVIISGTLCDEKENELTICEYYGIKFVDDENQTALKKQVLNYLTDNGNGTVYYKDIDGVISKIEPSDIDFKTVTNSTLTGGAIQSQGTDDAYYVVPCLKDKYTDSDGINWYTTPNPGEEDSSIEVEVINQALKTSQHAKIWKTGMTYYYTVINHFADKKGVVRNHIYDMNINAIYGLGTPVWDPEEKIYPEHPEDEDTYIAAKINILSWRIVNNDVILKW